MRRSYRSSPLRGPTALAVGADRAVLAGEVATSVGGIVTDARVVVGADRFPARAGSMSEGLDRRVEGMLDRLVTVGSSTLSIRSVTFQNSLRLAAGLALALVLGGVFEVENGFWVLFATLSVVRTSAPMTGASAFQAVFGTVIGFAIALPLLLAIGTREDLYLLVLPIVTVGGLLAGSLNVVWGQAGFTVLVLVLFNLVDPIGWEIGIIRVEDVALGAAVGVLIGLAAWPRGATGQLAQSLADAVEASGSLVAATMEGRLRPVSPERLSRLRSARAPRRCAPTACSPFSSPSDPRISRTSRSGSRCRCSLTPAGTEPRCWHASRLRDRHRRPPTWSRRSLSACTSSTLIMLRSPPRSPGASRRLRFARRSTLSSSTPSLAGWWRILPWMIPGQRGAWSTSCERALLAEITISLIGMRDLVSGLEGPSPEPNRAGAPSARYQFRSVRRPRRDRDEVERLTRRQRLRIERHEVDRCLGRQRLWVQGHQPDSCSGWQRLGVEGNEVDRLRRQRLRVERDEFDRRVRRQRLRVERDELDVRVGRQGLWVQRHEVDARLVH